MGVASPQKMKLFASVLALQVNASSWVQPTYRDILTEARERNGETLDWGHPIGRNSAAAWSSCPPLAKGDNMDDFLCNRSTCLLRCQPGFVKVGAGRARCKFTGSDGFHWGKPVGECRGCAADDPVAVEDKLDVACKLTKSRKRQCLLQCPVNHMIDGGLKPMRKFKIVCKCPRNKECGWFQRAKQISMENLSCQAKTTTTATTRTTRTTRTTTTTTPSPLNNDGGGVEFETGSNRLQFDSMCSLNANFARKLVDSDESKIVNGQVALSSSWPWIVRMSFRFASGSGLCGGSIIDDEWVLTAAHCCDNARSVQMTISDHNQAGRDSGEFSVTSSKIFIHPFYQRGNGLDWDVCLIKTPRLSSRSNNQSVFGAACIPRSMPNLHGKHCWVAGWGVGSEGGASQLLLNEVGVNIFSHEYCVNNSIYGNFIVEEAEICAGIPDRNNDGVADGGKDACQGDSGGPLICVEKGKPVLYGVVSWGEGCARRGAPGIYANVNAALEWIDDTILRN